jgi:hypothetical protein
MISNKVNWNFVFKMIVDDAMRVNCLPINLDVAVAVAIKCTHPEPTARVWFNENLVS